MYVSSTFFAATSPSFSARNTVLPSAFSTAGAYFHMALERSFAISACVRRINAPAEA